MIVKEAMRMRPSPAVERSIAEDEEENSYGTSEIKLLRKLSAEGGCQNRK